MSTRGTIITFYSYKGGVGRTFALASVGALLAHWRLRVLLVDWDLEAPGLTAYARVPAVDQPRGLLPLFQAFHGGSLPWQAHVLRGRAGGVDVDVIPACEGAEDLGADAQLLNWADLYERHGLGLAVEAMSEQWRAAYDVILVDSRTGFSDTAGICIVQLPDVVALLGSASQQSFRGLSGIARRIIDGRAAYPSERAGVHLVPVLTRFEGRVEHDRAKAWMETFEQALGQQTNTWLADQAPRLAVLTALRVPHVPYWSFGEEVPSPVSPSTPDDVGWAFENLAALLEHHLEGAARLADDRDGYVKESRTRREPYPAEVVLVALPDERRRAEELAEPYAGRVIVAAPHDQEEIARGRHVVFMIGDLNGVALDRAGSAVLRLWASRADLEDTSLSVLRVGAAAVPRSLQSQLVMTELSERLGVAGKDVLAPPVGGAGGAMASIRARVRLPAAWPQIFGQVDVSADSESIHFGTEIFAWERIKKADFSLVWVTHFFEESLEPVGVFYVTDPDQIVPAFQISVSDAGGYELLRLARVCERFVATTIADDLIQYASR